MLGITGISGKRNGRLKPGDTEFLARLKALTAAKEKYETIAREYKNAVAALQHTSRDRH